MSFSSGPPGKQAAGTPIYPDKQAIQNARLVTRLKARRLTPRLFVVYTASLALLVLARPWLPAFGAGALLCAGGLGVRIWSFGHLHKNQHLVTTGPYAHTRNPAYLGSALVMTGLFLAAGNPYDTPGIALWAAGALGLVIFFGGYLPRKYRREYGQLRRLFGPALDRHAAHVPNFWPRVVPWRSGDTQRFSWRCVSANHEWIWPAAVSLALALMWI